VLHPDLLRAQLSIEQLQGWRAFFEVERFGEHFTHKALGIVASVVLNCLVKKKDGGTFSPEEIIPWLEQREIVDGLITFDDPTQMLDAFDRTFKGR
jgi:hypothetical protein